MKKILVVLVCGLLLSTSVGVCSAAEFGPNSAELTGYFTVGVGDRLISMGCGPAGEAFYLDAVGIEEVVTQDSGTVRSLKVNALTDGTLVTLWLAQDIEGTLWVLKILFHAAHQTVTLGNGISHPFIPANPQVGDPVSHSWPEDERRCEVATVNLSIPEKTCWGQGPFSGCIEIRCGDIGEALDETDYICPEVGTVASYKDGLPKTELKEVIRNSCPADLDRDGVVDGRDLASFAEDYGGMCP